MTLSRLRPIALLVGALLVLASCSWLPNPEKERQLRRLHARSSYEQGLKHLNEGRISLGIAALNQAVELDPDEPSFHNALGVAQLQIGKPKEAQAEFERALALDKTYAEGYHNLALALAEQQRYQEASVAFRKAISLPLYATPELAYYNLGRLNLYHLNQRREAEEAFRASIKLAPRFAPAYYELGVVLNLQGRKDEARLAFRAARDIEPDSAFGRAAVEALKTLGDGG